MQKVEKKSPKKTRPLVLPENPKPGDRIMYLRRLKGLTQKNLGILLGEKQQIISSIEGNNRKSLNAFVLYKISVFFGVSMEWLLTGTERFALTLSNGRHQTVIDQNKNNPTVVGTAYIIEWDEVAHIYTSQDIKDLEGRPTMPLLGHAGPNSFALRLDGNSMASPLVGREDFRAGDLLLFDPDRQFTNGSYVLVYQEDKALFRQLQTDGGIYYLIALNPLFNDPTPKLGAISNIRGVLVTRLTMF
jgi:SOS-response transcriptional repressor LexA